MPRAIDHPAAAIAAGILLDVLELASRVVLIVWMLIEAARDHLGGPPPLV